MRSTYYTLLGIEPDASHAEITAAYERQAERYNPDRVAQLDPELHHVAAERRAELERIYRILADPQRRRQYDISIGMAASGPKITAAGARRSLSARERWYAAAGAIAAVAIVALIWTLTGRGAPPASPMGAVNRPAPEIALPTLEGGRVNLSSYRGQVVLINFWGTWCEPCKREMPALQTAYAQLRDQGFTVIGVNLANDEKARGMTEDKLRAFIQNYGVTYPIALDIDGDAVHAYRVFPLPTSFFVDPNGQIRYIRVGELTVEDVVARFTELKQEAAVLRD